MSSTTSAIGVVTAALAALLLAGCASGTSASVVPVAADARAGQNAANAVPAPPAAVPTVAPAAVAPDPALADAAGSGQPAPTETTRQTFGPGIRNLTVSDASGSVVVTGIDADRVTLVRHLFANQTRPKESLTAAGPDLRIDAPSCANDDWPRPCRIDYEIQVPRGTVVSLTSASGDLILAGLTGQQSAVAASGNVTVTGSSGALTARSTSGNVKVHATAVAASLTAASVSGNASVVVPPGRYRVATATTSGDRDVSLANDVDATASVEVTTVSGNVSLGTTDHDESD